MQSDGWQPVTRGKLIGFVVATGLFLLLVLRCESGFVPILDHANLVFHEAGHPLVGLFGSRLETYGGTIGQLVFPCFLMVSFWHKGQPLGLAAAWLWFCENWLNIARYMADARTLELPLVGGGDHDWNRILTRWNLLQYDLRIAATLKAFAWLGMAAACAWVFWRAWLGRHQPLQDPEPLAAISRYPAP